MGFLSSYFLRSTALFLQVFLEAESVVVVGPEVASAAVVV
jgi:hypothetical protein